jgi:hypothetical protein
MFMDWSSIVPALITGLLSLAGVYFANRKSSALIEYRLKELEKKVDRHNQVVERTFQLEGRMNEAEHDIRDLKGAKS